MFTPKRNNNPHPNIDQALRSLLCWTVALCIATSVSLAHSEPVMALAGAVTGNVTTHDAGPLPDKVEVQLLGLGNDEVVARAVAARNGNFHIGPIPAGIYMLIAIPPADSDYSRSLPKAVTVGDKKVDAGELKLTAPQIQGTVVAPDGETLVDALVSVSLADRFPIQTVQAKDGQFLVGGLPKGEYTLRARAQGSEPYGESEAVIVEITGPDEVKRVRLALRPAALFGTVVDAKQRAISGAKVVAVDQDGHQRSDRTDKHGRWAIGGLTDGTYLLRALPPFHLAQLRSTEPQSVSLPGATNPYTLTMSTANKEVSGSVKTNANVEVQNARIVAHRFDSHGKVTTLTDADGVYRLNLTSGLWSLNVEQITDTVPSGWVYSEAPRLLLFRFNDNAESKSEDFTVLSADAGVRGKITLPDGGVPPFTVTVGLHNDEGVGLRVDIEPADGTFALDLLSGGYKVAILPHDRGYIGPDVDPIIVTPENVTDLGTLALIAKDGLITGSVTDDSGSGIEGVAVNAWNAEVTQGVRTQTGPGGTYTLHVSAGTWNVQPLPGPQLPYVYAGESQKVTVDNAQTVSDINFELTGANATVEGVLVDEAGEPITDLYGWAQAKQIKKPTEGQAAKFLPVLKNGAPIANGVFTIQLPAGTYHVLALPAPGSPYLNAKERRVELEAGATVEIKMTLTRKSVDVGGTLQDARSGQIVTGVPGIVTAWSEGNLAVAPIHPNTGAFNFNLAPGIWTLNYRLHKRSDYVKIGGPLNVPVTEQRTAAVPVPLTVLEKDGLVSGSVLAPNGSTLSGIPVFLKGKGAEVKGLLLKTFSRRDGSFNIEAPQGTYHLGAASPNSDWIKPVEKSIEIGVSGLSVLHLLQFQEPTATITGTLTVSNAVANSLPLDRHVKVWAWSDDGGFTAERFPVTVGENSSAATGVYSLRVVSGTTWHVGANIESSDAYWRGSNADLVAAESAQIDVMLSGPHPKPGPVLVIYDAAESRTVELADGTTIQIPAGAMPVEGEVILRIVPLAELPNQKRARVVNYGYAFIATDSEGNAIEESFNQDVIITFAYDESTLEEGVAEDALQPAYFSTTTDEWTRPESYAVDAENNAITMQIDHFTDFAILTEVDGSSTTAPEDNTPDNQTPDENNTGRDLYLPLLFQ